MKQLKYFMFVAAMALAIVGCKKPVEVSFDKASQTMDAQGGTIELALKSNGEWNIAPTEDWVVVSPMSGKGDATLTLSVGTNTVEEARTTEIKATTKDNTATFTLTQNAAAPDPGPGPDPEPEYYLTVTPKEYECGSSGGEFTVEVLSNINWIVTTPQWITCSQTEGSNNATLTLTVHPMEGDIVSREDSVFIGNFVAFDRIHVVQTMDPVLGIDLTPKNLQFVNTGETKTVTVATEDAWTAAVEVGWVTLSQTEGQGEAEISVTVGENPVYVDRQTTVVFTTAGGIQAILAIRQDASVDPHFLGAYPLDFQFEKNGGQQEISVSCDTYWEFELSCDWLSLSQMSGTGNATVVLTADANPFTEARTAEFYIKSGELHEQFNVYQAPGDVPIFADFEPDTLFVSADGGIQHVQLTSNTNWQLQASDWILLLTSSGQGDANIDFVVDLNSEYEGRVGYVSVIHNGQELATMVVVQEAKVDIFETDITYLEVRPEGGEYAIQLTANQSWTVNFDVSWMRCEPMSGYGSKTLILTVEPLLSTHPRSGHMKLSGSAGMMILITVDQQ